MTLKSDAKFEEKLNCCKKSISFPFSFGKKGIYLETQFKGELKNDGMLPQAEQEQDDEHFYNS